MNRKEQNNYILAVLHPQEQGKDFYCRCGALVYHPWQSDYGYRASDGMCRSCTKDKVL